MTAVNPTVAMIVLNWNKWEITIECLESILQIASRDYEIVLVDNGSKDDSLERVQSFCRGDLEVRSPFFEYDRGSKPIPFQVVYAHPDGRFEILREERYLDSPFPRLTLLWVEENQGFSGGNNIGLDFVSQHLRPDYVLFMNNDVVVASGFLNALLDDIGTSGRTAISAPKIYYYDHQGTTNTINCAGCFLDMKRVRSIRRGRGEADRGQYNIGGEVDFADGACFLMRSTILDRTGGFDRSFFTYWEETDLCFRAKRLGYTCSYVPTSVVWHHESYSITTGSKEYYMTRNRYKFISKNGNRWERRRFMAYHLLALFIPTILTYLRDGEPHRIVPFIRGTIDGVRIDLASKAD